ncbi:MAG: hypothetical protein DRP52_05590 [Planctomycetota bacterium]|nr:MAG: hypothetical protein DRP52_05590 [Planctomycetota bacterium]
MILGIAAAMAVPMFSGAADMQVRSAANRIAADIDYAKGLAITHQQSYSLVFSGDSYTIQKADGTSVPNPLTGAISFVVNFSTDSRLSQVSIDSADFDPDSSDTITFDYLGSPYSGETTAPGNSLNSGQITLEAGSFSLTVDVEPVTGYVTIEDTP